MTDELYHKWRERKKDEPADKFDVNDFIRVYKKGKNIIGESIREHRERKKNIYSKIEELRLKVGLKPSKTFGGEKNK